MQLIGLSQTNPIENEAEILNSILDLGMDYFHIRKKNSSVKELEHYISSIDPKHYSKLILNSHHHLMFKYKLGGIHLNRHYRNNKFKRTLKLFYYRMRAKNLVLSTSFHNLAALYDETENYDYVFLSPIFDSISKGNYQSAFGELNLKKTLKKSPLKIIALGGIDEDKVEKVYDMGFHGLGMIGAIWEAKDPVEAFRRIKQKADSLSSVYNTV